MSFLVVNYQKTLEAFSEVTRYLLWHVQYCFLMVASVLTPDGMVAPTVPR